MSALLFQNDFLTTLAYLMGEKTVNTSTSAPRADFIQSALHDAYGEYPWIFARANATLTLSNGMATLPTLYDARHASFAKFTQSTSDVRLDPISDYDNGDVVNGDRAMWIEPIDAGDGTRYGIHVKDTDVSTVLFRYQKQEPTLDSGGTIGTPYPNKRTIALGARTFVKLGQNPDADVSQEEAQFDKSIAKDKARFQVQETRRRRRSRQEIVGSVTGEF